MGNKCISTWTSPLCRNCCLCWIGVFTYISDKLNIFSSEYKMNEWNNSTLRRRKSLNSFNTRWLTFNFDHKAVSGFQNPQPLGIVILQYICDKIIVSSWHANVRLQWCIVRSQQKFGKGYFCIYTKRPKWKSRVLFPFCLYKLFFFEYFITAFLIYRE